MSAKLGQNGVVTFAANYSITLSLLNAFRYGFTRDTTGTTNALNGHGVAA